VSPPAVVTDHRRRAAVRRVGDVLVGKSPHALKGMAVPFTVS
jgi:hypothetical protein